jgi:endonuclease/exonuclease/phosphatase family metal-dependent hydrolase
MDEATGFGPLLSASTPAEFAASVAATYQEVQASNPTERAGGVAREIALSQPTLVALQEASIWRTGSAGSPAATIVQFDQLAALLSALQARGLHYAPLAVEMNLDVEAPSTLGFDVRVTDRNVVLARTDLPTFELKVVNVQAQQFVNGLVVPTLAGQVTVPRSWIAVDAQIGGSSYRFITTHLEPNSQSVQIAQANELLQGPANVSLPVIIAGDLNTAASGGPDSDTTYANLLAAGFSDAWALTHPREPGFTWPLHGEDPYTFVLPPPLSERIDLVLVRNHLGVNGVERLNFTLLALTPSGLWPSDHAGVAAQLELSGSQ